MFEPSQLCKQMLSIEITLMSDNSAKDFHIFCQFHSSFLLRVICNNDFVMRSLDSLMDRILWFFILKKVFFSILP